MIASPESEFAAPPQAWVHGVIAVILRRWWLMPLMMAVGLVLAAVYLHRAQYFYSAELKVYAAPSSSGKSAQSALSGLAALTGLAGGSTSEAVPPFRFYLDAIYSPEIARRMARDRAMMHTIFAAEWDEAGKRWREPPSFSREMQGAIMGVLGLPQAEWQPPDADRLRGFIAYAVTVRQSVKTPIATIGFEYPDPVFATSFIEKLHKTVDSYLREQQAARTRGNIAYLTTQLQTVTLAEQRFALVGTLTEQERQAMLAYGNAPYAAEPFDLATASLEPTRPRPMPVLIGGLVTGLILGIVAALWFGRRELSRARGTDLVLAREGAAGNG